MLSFEYACIETGDFLDKISLASASFQSLITKSDFLNSGTVNIADGCVDSVLILSSN